MEIDRLRSALKAIALCTRPGNRSAGGLVRDMQLANQIASAALTPHTSEAGDISDDPPSPR